MVAGEVFDFLDSRSKRMQNPMMIYMKNVTPTRLIFHQTLRSANALMFDFRIGRGPDPDFRTGLGGNLEVSQLFHSGWPLILSEIGHKPFAAST